MVNMIQSIVKYFYQLKLCIVQNQKKKDIKYKIKFYGAHRKIRIGPTSLNWHVINLGILVQSDMTRLQQY